MLDLLDLSDTVLYDVVRAVLLWTAIPTFAYFMAINLSYGMLMLLGWWDVRRSAARRSVLDLSETATAPISMGITVVMPAWNEAALIGESVRSILALDYPDHEVIVVNDGSTDDTLEVLTRAFDLRRSSRSVPTGGPVEVRGAVRGVYEASDPSIPLVVLDTENSGRSDAVNAGIAAGTKDLMVFLDADSVLDTDALLLAVQPFLDDPLRVVATGGSVRAVNGCRVVAGRVTQVGLPSAWIARFQVLEYLRAFSLGRAGWSMVRCLMLISGAFGVYRRDILLHVGGLDADTIGEDFELAMAVHRWCRRRRRDYRMQFVTEPASWTEVPDSLAVLRRQRVRWHRGLWEVLWKYRRMTLNPRYGRVGMVGLPYYWLFELFAPLFEVLGVVIIVLALLTGAVDPVMVLVMLGLALGAGILVSVFAVLLEELSFHRLPRW
ncbi:glycosyltransferase [Brachybacterium sp. p3-SID1565]|uniref:glycosyltransferase family 2 protein n=1 Tax=Brachybacterium sp. p3-SID1565 TaxID=2916046 RepID=UPI0021A35A87|nr:glycosyltransferase family 2 protein [Brachybacterium sp. p3-SID1565]MCT1385753.1 glycosyltransferase [Brachybacterium sp. p3-SID1565]